MKMVIPITIRNARARIFKAIFFRMKSPIGLAKQRITKKELKTAVTIIHLLLVSPTAVITESREKTISKITICEITLAKPDNDFFLDS